MPSKSLGRLRPPPRQRALSHNDDVLKQARSRSYSDRSNQNSQQQQQQQQHTTNSPGPLPSDRGASDSYFTAVQRRTEAQQNIDVNETDDFGYPRSGLTQSPTEIDTSNHVTIQLLKGKCRICDVDVQIPANSSAKCDECLSFNSAGSSSAQSSQARIVSLNRGREIIERAINEGLKKITALNKAEAESSYTIGKDHPSHVSSPSKTLTLFPLEQNLRVQRRGSASDTPHPSVRSRSPQKSTSGSQSPERRHVPRSKPANTNINASTRSNRNPSPGPLSASTPLFNKLPPWSDEGSSPPKYVNIARQSKVEILRDSFRPIFDMLSASIHRELVNTAFSTLRHSSSQQAGTKQSRIKPANPNSIDRLATPPPQISQMNHKDLMIGDVYDVASSLVTDTNSPLKRQATNAGSTKARIISQSSAHIDWPYLIQWYRMFIAIGLPLRRYVKPAPEDETSKAASNNDTQRARILEDLGFEIRAEMLKLMEQSLVRPQARPNGPEEIRYLLIMLANPILLSHRQYPVRLLRRSSSAMQLIASPPHKNMQSPMSSKPAGSSSRNFTTHSRVLSLLIGTLSNSSPECLSYATCWLMRYPENEFRSHVDALLGFVTERIALRRVRFEKASEKKASVTHHGVTASQMFNDILQSNFDPVQDDDRLDWQLKAACKVLQMFARANDHFIERNIGDTRSIESTGRRKPLTKQLIPTEHFYISQLDDKARFDSRKDFDNWEKKSPGLQLSQYPFLMSLGTKITILEFDARRKMETRARQEFFDSIMRHTSVDKNFHISIRRQCVVEDSLQRISEAVNSAEGEAKKALKVHFDGEDGIDAGGPRKEWFLLLMKELLDPEVGLFIYNEDTNYCYFNPLSFESTEQYQLVGAVLGLAIYNFTILDVPFPPFLFRKLVAGAPQIKGFDLHQGWKPTWRPELADLAQYDPMLARNLQYILDYEGDLAEEVCATFDVEISHHGVLQKSSLHAGEGEKIVDKENRADYVRQYVDFILDRSVRKQFEAFARGFFNVCWGNALSLFRGEEIELLIRGSSDLNFSVLRGSAVYENWKIDEEGQELTSATSIEESFPVVRWFWELMEHADVDDQKRVLRWITGSDRVPATGIGSLSLKIQRLGDDSDRLPQCRTCFNTLQLWNYKSRRTFVNKFWYAVIQSGEGFGLK